MLANRVHFNFLERVPMTKNTTGGKKNQTRGYNNRLHGNINQVGPTDIGVSSLYTNDNTMMDQDYDDDANLRQS